MQSGSTLEEFDTLVLADNRMQALKDCSSQLKPGGVLYWEVCRGLRHPRLSSMNRLVAAAEQAGFREIETYWHRPDFAACREIIPLGRPYALAQAFAKTHRSVVGRAKVAAGRFIHDTGLLQYLAPCVSVVATRPD